MTETKQNQPTEPSAGALRAAERIAGRLMSYPSELREWREVRWEKPEHSTVSVYMAQIIYDETRQEAQQELLDAAKLQVQNFHRQNLYPEINNLGDDDHEAWGALSAAIAKIEEK